HFPSGPSVGKTGPVWPSWPCLMIESASVVCKTYGLLTSSVRWQYETFSAPGAGAVVGCGGAVVPVVVDELEGGAAAVDDEDEGGCVVFGGDVVDEVVAVVVAVSAPATPPCHRAQTVPMPIPRTKVRRTRAPYTASPSSGPGSHTARRWAARSKQRRRSVLPTW